MSTLQEVGDFILGELDLLTDPPQQHYFWQNGATTSLVCGITGIHIEIVFQLNRAILELVWSGYAMRDEKFIAVRAMKMLFPSARQVGGDGRQSVSLDDADRAMLKMMVSEYA